MLQKHHYNVAIVGGGISGTALLYTLAKYTDIDSIALFEKYEDLSTLNSNAKGNSQTLHCGDIETNYTLEKAKITNRTASMSPDVNDPGFRAITFDDLVISYSEQINALIDGGVDILLIETIFDTLNAKAALFAVDSILEKRKISVPIMLSGTITDASGRTLSGQTVEAFVTSLSHIPLLSIGLNCALGADLLLPYMKRLSQITEFHTSAHPNAGLPNAFGEYDQTPEEMKELILEYLKLKCVNIIGGCCGTTPEHIKLIAQETKKFQPRSLN